MKTNYYQFIHDLIFKRNIFLPQEISKSYRIVDGIYSLEQKICVQSEQDCQNEGPVFIFAPSWRSGSTLLQRIIISSGEVMIWGEPLDNSSIVQKLSQTLIPFSNKWPPKSFFPESLANEKLFQQWIANLIPSLDSFKQSQKSFFQIWLEEPAKRLFQVKRWGFKEVRLTIDHAFYLKWLYPNASFLFIFRNPIDCYRSWKGNLWTKNPNYNTFSPIIFARHWSFLLNGYLNSYRSVDGMLVKYEDLINDYSILNQIANHINVQKINTTALKKNISEPNKMSTSKQKPTINFIEKILIKYFSNNVMKKIGY